ncbi:alcohol dehydrogenase [Salipaludibacillus neizhouensis]|uniref:Alcohol dehydrogenase n=1 Tax=Salipaludibacillus neizhouensis TaxID=885475 RepID=A0A3A9KFU9_9BACI|nr:zinc-binding alcohol dehydrogenase family protein [Salipaludibacillus neizhouensis]RKL66515.1 alcohol dehydrogenase [Salipaludibacillus neizhouensis]
MRVISCEDPKLFVEKTEGKPKIVDGEVLIEIKKIGICGTDIHAYHGSQPFFTYPRVLGHELAGIVKEVGNNENKLKIGDQVTVIPYMECGTCKPCRSRKTNCCTNIKVLGVHIDGGMREYLRVAIDHVIQVNNISLDEASMIEPLSIGAHAVKRSNLQEGQVALVIGAGPIGLGVMKFAKLTGAKVIAMDINEDRLKFCKEWAEANHTINALDDAKDHLNRLTDSDFPDVVFDATGNKMSMMNAFNYVGHGGQLVYVGLIKEELTFNDPEFHKREMSLLASRNATLQDFNYVINCIEKGLIDVDKIISDRISFSNLIDEFEELFEPSRKVIKAVVEL